MTNILDVCPERVSRFVFLSAGLPYCALVEYPVAEQLKFLTLDAKSEKAKTLLTSWGGIQLGKLALATSGAIVFYWFARR